MKKILFASFILLAGSITGFAEAPPLISSRSRQGGPNGGSVNRFTLPNGVQILHKEITTHPLVTFLIFTHGGSINEKESQAGLANFTQSLLMQGTATRDAEKLSQEIEDMGANITNNVDNDYAVLGISAMDQHIDRAVDILADLAFNPVFPETEIEKERSNTLAGIKSRQDHIFQVAEELFLKEFYGTHPYSWQDDGKAETVSKFTREDLTAWHASYYAPADMLIVVAGNITQEKTRELAERYFTAPGSAVVRETSPAAALPKKKEVAKETKKFQQAYLMLGFPAPALGTGDNPDFMTLKVMNALLGGRMSGRLFTELREKLSLAYEVNSFYTTRRDLSRFVIYMGLEKKNLPLARKRIFELIEDLKHTPVSEKELTETKNYIRGVFLLDHQTIGRQAWYLGWWEILGAGYEFDERYLAQLMAVTPEDLQKAARKYFTDDYVQIELVPQK